jgi:arylsulfatase A-like enzyme
MPDRPNFLLIVGEDTGRLLGCYGAGTRTPHLDRLAAEGRRYDRAYATYPVCAPSRSSIVTGQHPMKIGTHHMRSTLLDPPRLFTHELRDAGYRVSWPGKLDFNFDATIKPGWRDDDDPWLERLRAGRMPPRPWLAYTNLEVTHESRIWPDAGELDGREGLQHYAHPDRPPRITDPARVEAPPYLADTPVVRNDIARHADNIAELDRQVGEILAALEASGQARDTVVIFLADHGRGLPREKRWPYPAGIHMPLIIRHPAALAPSGVDDGLVSWVDIAPTILSLAGVAVPRDYDGRAFLGPAATSPPRQYVFAGRDRMDEAFDRVRVACDGRYHYIRNYFPQIPYCQRNAYMENMPTTQELRRLQAEGRLRGDAAVFMRPRKPEEELYDLSSDPHCVRNRAGDPARAEVHARLAGELDRFLAAVDDKGRYTERDLIARGLVADRLSDYRKWLAPLPPAFQAGYPPAACEPV